MRGPLGNCLRELSHISMMRRCSGSSIAFVAESIFDATTKVITSSRLPDVLVRPRVTA
ncbi:hypothetical protein J2W56_001087 [Nocardia kruczakiae]|uniref:Uncharacterized protein n=1 Tax=Nocardia kruczakiae TaxID=261477 RepID=A0ABU1XA06_9NOCA|nr:hypothetical protein [Nocardia kruczakiae]